MSFKIDPDFKTRLPPQTPEQRRQLRLKIELEGPLPGSLVVADIRGERWLIDGHNTLEVCQELGRPAPAPRVISLPSKEDALRWIDDNQQARRNVTPEQAHAWREQRIARVAEARQEGKSLRTIAEEQGVSKTQVEEDLKHATVQGWTVAPKNGRVQSRDGIERPAEPTRPPPQSARRKQDGPRPGTPVFTLKDFNHHLGGLVRQIDALAGAYRQKETPRAEGLRRLLSEYKNQFEAWHRELSKTRRQS